MSTLKAQFDEHRARELLQPHYSEVGTLTPLRGGEASQAFAFTANGANLVLRVNLQADYVADAWTWRKTTGCGIPVPRIFATGSYEGFYYAISERAAGQMLYDLPLPAVRALIPEMVAILLRIHAVSITDTAGFGLAIGGDDKRYPSWHAFVEQYDILGDFIDWPRALQQADARLRRLIEACWARGRALLTYCPEERVLNHGDYNLANILADQGHITGVIDWHCCYGDPLRDVAWVDFWAPELEFSQAYLAQRPTADARQRLLCYRLFMAARSLGFFLHTQQPHKAAHITDQVATLLREAQR
jgi:hygromycin-B 4-O-kinase